MMVIVIIELSHALTIPRNVSSKNDSFASKGTRNTQA